MTPAFRFTLPTRVRFGAGCRAELVEVLRGEGWRRVGVVVDHNLTGVSRVGALIEELRTSTEALVVGQCRIQEPTYDAIEQARTTFEGQSLDAIVGIGGGSALDMAKAMAVLATNDGPAISYRGFDRVPNPALGIVAVPTTAGTGSEATPNASFIDTREQFKMGINGEVVRPRHAILDPELTLSCPAAPTLSAAADSMVHATEAFVARKTNPMARLFAREGFRTVFTHLPDLLGDPDNLDLRSRVMYGAFLSGVALMHSGTGPAAALSYPLGVRYGVPHGIAGAVFLPHVVRYNVEQGVSDYGLMHDGNGGSHDPGRARAFSDAMFERWQELGVPASLDVLHPDVSSDVMVDDTLKLAAALDQNPVTFGADQIRTVLSRLGASGSDRARENA